MIELMTSVSLCNLMLPVFNLYSGRACGYSSFNILNMRRHRIAQTALLSFTITD